jgi:hypothetical protein
MHNTLKQEAKDIKMCENANEETIIKISVEKIIDLFRFALAWRLLGTM